MSDSLAGQARTDEPAAFLGPIGLGRLYSRETIIPPQQVSGAAKATQAPFGAVIDGATGLTDVVYGDSFNIDIPLAANAESTVLIGMTRYHIEDTETFSASYNRPSDIDDRTAAADVANRARNRALSLLHGGMMENVQWHIQNGTDAVSDSIRSFLFGGDNYVEAGLDQVLFGESADGYYAKNDILAGIKAIATIGTPYRYRNL